MKNKSFKYENLWILISILIFGVFFPFEPTVWVPRTIFDMNEAAKGKTLEVTVMKTSRHFCMALNKTKQNNAYSLMHLSVRLVST